MVLQLTVEITTDSAYVGQGEDLVPHGNTVLSRGDRILLFGLIDAVHDARQELMAIE